MSRGRTSLLAGVVLALGLGACGDDFDALFANGPIDGGPGGGGDGDSGGAGDAGSDSTAPDAAPSCASGQAQCTCSTGSTCNSSCDVDGECTATANRNSRLTYECREHVDTCVVECDHADCDFRCDAEGTCSMACADDSTCVLRCTGRASSCNLTCGDGVKRDCGSGVFTCSPTCP